MGIIHAFRAIAGEAEPADSRPCPRASPRPW
ncbi:MAG TPA: hypothetical protein VF179_19385 [Thermoanaerobaculia bacterium]|nr:hypothetical protein [Thermoanaerobaculia bacterium]